ncbi:MAG: Stealth CR1 domain-containing protein [Erysipelotrichales bacterium]|nr:Stealth CR1 domain-containing protein [Erysipelotrichales bacterium]
MNKNPIDFVILWVNPNDESWQRDRNRFKTNVNTDERIIRYRDWENLQYLFRGIEKFTPWVNKVHFITYGHLPKWLNVHHPKLNIVNHKDYIPENYLPTFNSDSIELNLHRLDALSENFVIFNDDTFVLKEMLENDFFVDDKPRDAALLNVHCYDMETIFTLAPFVNIGVINKYFDMHKVIKENLRLWFHPSYGISVLRNLYLQPCPRFPGMRMDHLPCSHLKSTFSKLWDLEYDIFDQTSKNRFREKTSINHWVMKEWNIASGNFVPRSPKVGKSFAMNCDNINYIGNCISQQKYKLICLNDTEMTNKEFDLCKEKIIKSFEIILSEKSEFEI